MIFISCTCVIFTLDWFSMHSYIDIAADKWDSHEYSVNTSGTVQFISIP